MFRLSRKKDLFIIEHFSKIIADHNERDTEYKLTLLRSLHPLVKRDIYSQIAVKRTNGEIFPQELIDTLAMDIAKYEDSPAYWSSIFLPKSA